MKYFIFIFAAGLYFSCSPVSSVQTASIKKPTKDSFWNALQSLCGKSFEGTVINAPATDTVFKNKKLLMHVRNCNNQVIRIPFVVGNDRSRTWVFTRRQNDIQLKHDHRHEDGTEDTITQYGGATANSGSATLQMFPADQHTVNILPAAATNVWWVELVPGSHYSYNLRRMGTDRIFTIRFDLTKPVEAPAAPWGWKD